MKQIIAKFLKHFSTFLEYFIAIMLGFAILLLSLTLAASLANIPDLSVWPNYEDILEICFNLIIGVELIRMMYQHSPDTVFEVLLFAIARQIITDHSSIWSSLIGVCAIAVLFATRKFLFEEFDLTDEMVFRATTKVHTANKILGTKIPHEDGQTLSDVILKKFEEDGTEIGIGASVFIGDAGLRVAKMYQGKISRIEVIHAIH